MKEVINQYLKDHPDVLDEMLGGHQHRYTVVVEYKITGEYVKPITDRWRMFGEEKIDTPYVFEQKNLVATKVMCECGEVKEL